MTTGMPCLITDFTFRQPLNPSEMDMGTGTEGLVEEDGQGTNGRGAEISIFSENVKEETIKNTSIDLLSIYCKAMQQQKSDRELIRQGNE